MHQTVDNVHINYYDTIKALSQIRFQPFASGADCKSNSDGTCLFIGNTVLNYRFHLVAC